MSAKTGYQHTTAYRGGAFMQLRSTILRPGWTPPDDDLADRIDTLPAEQSAPGVNQQYDRGPDGGPF